MLINVVCLSSCHDMKCWRSSSQLSPRHEKLCMTSHRPMACGLNHSCDSHSDSGISLPLSGAFRRYVLG